MTVASRLASAAVVLSLLATAAKGQERREGGSTDAKSVEGTAFLVGYLAQCMVFIDTNDNAALDADEPSAMTDEFGRYQMWVPWDGASGVVVVGSALEDTSECTDVFSKISLRGPLKATTQGGVVSALTNLANSVSKHFGSSSDVSDWLVAAGLGLPVHKSLQSWHPLLHLDRWGPLQGDLDREEVVVAASAAVGGAVELIAAVLVGASDGAVPDVVAEEAAYGGLAAQVWAQGSGEREEVEGAVVVAREAAASYAAAAEEAAQGAAACARENERAATACGGGSSQGPGGSDVLGGEELVAVGDNTTAADGGLSDAGAASGVRLAECQSAQLSVVGTCEAADAAARAEARAAVEARARAGELAGAAWVDLTDPAAMRTATQNAAAAAAQVAALNGGSWAGLLVEEELETAAALLAARVTSHLRNLSLGFDPSSPGEPSSFLLGVASVARAVRGELAGAVREAGLKKVLPGAAGPVQRLSTEPGAVESSAASEAAGVGELPSTDPPPRAPPRPAPPPRDSGLLLAEAPSGSETVDGSDGQGGVVVGPEHGSGLFPKVSEMSAGEAAAAGAAVLTLAAAICGAIWMCVRGDRGGSRSLAYDEEAGAITCCGGATRRAPSGPRPPPDGSLLGMLRAKRAGASREGTSSGFNDVIVSGPAPASGPRPPSASGRGVGGGEGALGGNPLERTHERGFLYLVDSPPRPVLLAWGGARPPSTPPPPQGGEGGLESGDQARPQTCEIYQVTPVVEMDRSMSAPGDEGAAGDVLTARWGRHTPVRIGWG